jgi:hypothetical protein
MWAFLIFCLRLAESILCEVRRLAPLAGYQDARDSISCARLQHFDVARLTSALA